MPVLGSSSLTVDAAGGGGFLADCDVPVIGIHQEDPTTVCKIIKRRGFNPVWVSELAAAMDNDGGLPPQPVMLVFDDGDPLWYTRTHPALVQYGIKATMAVTSNYLYGLTTTAFGGAQGITWDQAREMHASGLYDWQNHGQTHATTPSDSELTTCNAAIVAELGVAAPVAHIYPHGSYNADITGRLAALGFKLAFKYGANDSERPSPFPGTGPFVINRTMDLTDPLKWARQTVLYDFGHDMTGGRNAANALGFWTFSAAQAAHANQGAFLQLNSTATSSALTATTTDYFHVLPGTRLYSHCTTASAGQTAGTARVSVRQYDKDRVELTRLDLHTVSATEGNTERETTVAVDAACEFVRLEVGADAAYDGTFDVRQWLVRVR